MAQGFWLNDMQWARLAPLLPNKPRGVPRVDDRRVISGIVVALQSGGRWIDVPAEYGPRKTLYNRFVRWSSKGIWQELFQTLTAAGGAPAEVLLNSTHIKAHRCAAGGKGAPRPRRSASAAADVTTKIHALSDGQGRPLAFLLTGGRPRTAVRPRPCCAAWHPLPWSWPTCLRHQRRAPAD